MNPEEKLTRRLTILTILATVQLYVCTAHRATGCNPPKIDFEKLLSGGGGWPAITLLNNVCVDQETFIVYDAEVGFFGPGNLVLHYVCARGGV